MMANPAEAQYLLVLMRMAERKLVPKKSLVQTLSKKALLSQTEEERKRLSRNWLKILLVIWV